MSLFFKNREGQTPIDESIKIYLKAGYVQDMTELYELESENIAMGIAWSYSTEKDPLDYMTWIELHKQLFKDIWKFAGVIRDVELANSDFQMPFNIRPALRELEQDLRTWIEFKHPPKEMMAQFHERLLTIHPFRDGNGRWSRVLTEFVCMKKGFEMPSWGSRTFYDEDERRNLYISAIKVARREFNFARLIEIMWA